MIDTKSKFAGDWKVTFSHEEQVVYVVEIAVPEDEEIMAAGFDKRLVANEALVAIAHIVTDVLHMDKVRQLAMSALKGLVTEGLFEPEEGNDIPF